MYAGGSSHGVDGLRFASPVGLTCRARVPTATAKAYKQSATGASLQHTAATAKAYKQI